jgi:hypothetical protein
MQPVKGTSNAGCVNTPAYGGEAVLYDLETEENVSARTLCRAEQKYFLDFKEHFFIQKIIFFQLLFCLANTQ